MDPYFLFPTFFYTGLTVVRVNGWLPKTLKEEVLKPEKTTLWNQGLLISETHHLLVPRVTWHSMLMMVPCNLQNPGPWSSVFLWVVVPLVRTGLPPPFRDTCIVTVPLVVHLETARWTHRGLYCGTLTLSIHVVGVLLFPY